MSSLQKLTLTAVVGQIDDELSQACCLELRECVLHICLELIEVVRLERTHEHLRA